MNILQTVLYNYAKLGYITRHSNPTMYDQIIDLWKDSDIIEIRLYEPENGVAFVLLKNKDLLTNYIPENRI